MHWFLFLACKKNSKNKSEWERLWLRWENKIIYPWENVTCTLAKRGVMAVQNEAQEPNPVSEQNKHGQQLVLSYILQCMNLLRFNVSNSAWENSLAWQKWAKQVWWNSCFSFGISNQNMEYQKRYYRNIYMIIQYHQLVSLL